MRRLTDSQVRSCSSGKKISEAVEPTGALVMWHKSNGTKEWYYRKQRKNDKDINEKLGTYPTLRLADARNAAADVAKIASDNPDLKLFRRVEVHAKERAAETQRREQMLADSLGTLEDLCRVYISKMQNEGRLSYRKVESSLRRYVLDPFPDLAEKKANQVKTADVSRILSYMLDKGITTHVNRTRGDLHAAFNLGLTYDYTPSVRTEENLIFDIHKNPVSRIKATKRYERALSRNLSAEDLTKVWYKAPEVLNPVYASLLRVMLCTGFHPAELLRLKCSDVNLDEKSIYMVQTKSGLPNLIPLNKFAIQELSTLLENSNPNDDLFPSRAQNPKSDIYSRVSVLGNQVSRLRSALPDIEHFTARDFRRTVKTLMGLAGVSKEMRDRLQNHALSGVSSKHYDRYDYWREKVDATQTWEGWLDKNVIRKYVSAADK